MSEYRPPLVISTGWSERTGRWFGLVRDRDGLMVALLPGCTSELEAMRAANERRSELLAEPPRRATDNDFDQPSLTRWMRHLGEVCE